MRFNRAFCIIILALLTIFFAREALAQDTSDVAPQSPSDGTLHVLRPVLHTELDKAELCLEFDHALAPVTRLTAPITSVAAATDFPGLHLTSSGKKIPLSVENVSVTSSLLCFPPLDYHQEYHVTASNMRGLNNEKMAEPYSFSFATPSRTPTLAFMRDNNGSGMARWQDDDPMLRAINVTHAHVELHRIEGLDAIIEAWFQRQQTTLAPSESAYFAKDRGNLTWQGEVNFGDTPDATLEKNVPLHNLGDMIANGLYLITATAPSVAIKSSDVGLAPQAAKWLLRTNLRVRAKRAHDGLYVLSEKRDSTSIAEKIHVSLLDRAHHVLADATTDTNGITFIPIDANKLAQVALLMGQSPDGDIDFSDVSINLYDVPTAPSLSATLSGLKSFYKPDENVSLTLGIHDIGGNKVNVKGSVIQLLYLDNSVLMQIAVPEVSSSNTLSFAAPIMSGEWQIVWRSADGTILKSGTLRVSDNPDAPQVNFVADRKMLSENGELNLTITTTTDRGTPAPYVSGRVSLNWVNTNKIFSGWDEYHFGVQDSPVTSRLIISHFTTDASGLARLHLVLAMPMDLAPARAAILAITPDTATSAIASDPIILPIKPREFIIGIKPFVANGQFAENSLAHFSIVALDADGRRRDVNGLAYQIYNEGRSFDWYAREGTWDYKPLQHMRHLGGKPISIGADTENVIEWPVTAGSYRLDITDANGTTVGRYEFSAGWGLAQSQSVMNTSLNLTADPGVLVRGKPVSIHFKLEKDSTIFASIADDHVRQVIHQSMPQGDGHITFVPSTTWGDTLIIHVEAKATNTMGDITLSTQNIAHDPQKDREPSLEAVAKNSGDGKQKSLAAEPLSILGEIPSRLVVRDVAKISLIIQNNQSKPALGTYRYTLTSGTGLKVSDTGTVLHLAAGKANKLQFNLEASQPGVWELKIDLSESPQVHLLRRWTVNVESNPSILGPSALEQVPAHGSIILKSDDKPHQSAQVSQAFVGSISPLNAPAILARYLISPVLTTRDMARRLETLRQWREIIVSSELIPEAVIKIHERDLLQRLMLRQKKDGGFPNLPDGESDLESTALVTIALSHADPAITLSSLRLANMWMKHKLENNWFDESERSVRSSVYASLAATGNVDLASLHFFADTSADKDLSALTNANIALTFALTNDRDQSAWWLARVKIPRDAAPLPIELLLPLANNAQTDLASLLPPLQKLSDELTNDAFVPSKAAIFLQSLLALQQRAVEWHGIINGQEKTARNFLGFINGGKGFAIHNLSNNPLYIASVTVTLGKPSQISTNSKGIMRRLYHTNGSQVDMRLPLQTGATYLVVLDVPSSQHDKGQALFVHDDPYPALEPLGCALPAKTETSDQLAWIKGLNLTDPSSCEKVGNALTILADSKEASQPTAHFAYFAKADWTGNFESFHALASTSDETISTEDFKSRLVVK